MDRLAELQIFVEVIERGDYSAAARSLGLTPSAVSKAVKRLETRLGARLLDRTSRMMRATADGDTLYLNARRAIESIEDAEASVSGSLSKAHGDLTVHLPPTFAVYQVSRLIPEFRERYPDIRLAFIVGNEPLDMAEHRIDCTIVIGRPADSDLIVRKIATSRWLICASPRYLEQRGWPKSVDDLQNHECLGFVLRAPGSPATKRQTLEPSLLLSEGSSIAANNGSMLQALARVGTGIVRLADYHVAGDLLAGRLVRLFPEMEEEREDVYAIYPRKLRGSTRLRVLLDFMREKFSEPDWGMNEATMATYLAREEKRLKGAAASTPAQRENALLASN